MPTTWRSTVPALSLVVVLLVACGTGDGDAPPDGANGGNGSSPAESMPADESQAAGDTTVVIDALAFGQNEITVPAGTTVTWENQDSVPHTVTHGTDGQPAGDALFDMSVAAGGSASYTFDEAGEYGVTCTIHPQMNMTVVVEG